MHRKWLKLCAIMSVSFLLIVSGASLSAHIEQTRASTTAKVKYVYIAPTSGKKFHSKKSCRGLRRARVIKRVKLSYAKRSYSKCKICY